MNRETMWWVRSVADLWERTPLSWIQFQAVLRKCGRWYRPVVLPGNVSNWRTPDEILGSGKAGMLTPWPLKSNRNLNGQTRR